MTASRLEWLKPDEMLLLLDKVAINRSFTVFAYVSDRSRPRNIRKKKIRNFFEVYCEDDVTVATQSSQSF